MAKTKRHPGTIEQHGPSLRVALKVGGVRHRFTLAGATKREAEEFATRKEEELRELLRRERLGLPGVTRLSVLLDRYEAERLPTLAPNTRRAYAGSIERTREYFCSGSRDVEPVRRDPSVEEIRGGHITGFMNWRRLRRLQSGKARAPGKSVGQVSGRTLSKDRAVLHAVFAYAVELDMRDSNPVAKTKPAKSDPRSPTILTDDQYSALLAAADGSEMLRLYILALGETGGRCESEILFLQWQDVDFEGGFLQIASGREGRRTKGGRTRWVPMTAQVVEAFREHFARYRLATYGGARTTWIFHHTLARRHAKPGQRIRSLRRAFRGAALRAGLPAELHQHDLRHRRVTTWLAEGKNAVHVKEAVGHADLRTTMGYTHLAREHLRSLVSDTGSDENRRFG